MSQTPWSGVGLIQSAQLAPLDGFVCPFSIYRTARAIPATRCGAGLSRLRDRRVGWRTGPGVEQRLQPSGVRGAIRKRNGDTRRSSQSPHPEFSGVASPS